MAGKTKGISRIKQVLLLKKQANAKIGKSKLYNIRIVLNTW